MRVNSVYRLLPRQNYSTSCICSRQHASRIAKAAASCHRPLQRNTPQLFIPRCSYYSTSAAVSPAPAPAPSAPSSSSSSPSFSSPLESPSSSSVKNQSSNNSNPKNKRTLRSKTAVITLTDAAVQRLASLTNNSSQSSSSTSSSSSSSPASSSSTSSSENNHNQLLRIGVRNKGCAGMSYHLEYVSQPSKFDEIVHQDGVTVLVDSKALFSIIGSQMDWQETPLAAKFVFTNPNIKDQCGCGESFIA